MRSAKLGESTSAVELANVSVHGMWILLEDRELYLPFEQFPWFRNASIRQLANIERSQPNHLYWPDLDVDLTVESIEHPEKYPLVSRARPARR